MAVLRAKEAGLIGEGQPRVTFHVHDLRHAFASSMIERGLSSSVLALELLQRLVRDRELVDGGPVA